ncbi:MAG TPA: methylmalonyl Co-A mutase-associated GTPase MeaB [Alphaproteobacteria bacterium]|nr:methylmalonyl Co-A mutase-associated GTPase MeaB [Alphaproteobacteria bacterium]HBA41525.1 methylmalonyl Co-A mutase-associated GTPase MeaB [Alphaproteobacteria bacterium]
MARALAAAERFADRPELVGLLDACWAGARAHVVGLTGPPGVGKSTLINSLIGAWRAAGRTVGVIAVDPTSRRTGGALLGDRTRLATDPEDHGIFVRSMAARDRLGGLAALTMPAMVLMRAVYDIVLVETVGIGQSETDIADLADTVIFCIQPGSGDSLQYMKAGIMEVPHIAVVTKADMGAAARRAKADVEGAMGLSDLGGDGWMPQVLTLSAARSEGIDALVAEIDRHRDWLERSGEGARTRLAQARHWLHELVREEFGRHGLAQARDQLTGQSGNTPFAAARAISQTLKQRPSA